MKNSIFKTSILAIILGVIFVACEKSEEVLTKETIEFTEEGFKSMTGNYDQVLNDGKVKRESPLLHMRFDKDLSKEEAELTWNNAVKNYISKNPIQNKGVSTEWFFNVVTYTGTQTNNGTDATVQASATFSTDKGNTTSYMVLNNAGNDREEGQTDYYLFRTSYPGQAVSWVETESARLSLKGPDGWFVKGFHVLIYASDQSISASGYSYLFSLPNVWLDNTTATGWDYYYTTNPGIGRLNF